VAALGVLLILGENVPGQPAPRPARAAPAAAAQATGQVRAGQVLFRRSCARCHDRDGKGSDFRDSAATIPDFTSHHWHTGRSNPQLLVSILEGKGTRMPAFGGRLTPDQARALVAFIRSFDPTQTRHRRPSASDFQKRFAELQEQWDELERQWEELMRSSRRAERIQPTHSTPSQ
jgi:mono/diheme cytochrome c family protein